MKKKRLLFVFGFLIIFGLIYVGSIHNKISRSIKVEVPNNADYLIILGAKVNGNIPSLSLSYRINTAAEYLLNNPNTIAIASGGMGPGETITEAEAIQNGLIAKGIDESRIFLEDRSTSTYENVSFSKSFIPNDAQQGIIVTNDYHVYRAVQIAGDADLHVAGLAADTPKVTIVKAYIREYLAVTKYYLQKYIF
ncbi:YdcF family protein [Ferdinandcohnia quinoae]|uniref:YdcF family protein n=1 Tax=Fredinandcohnia quinoae TaxID=2918902 RepID=A0AAW5E258_9BACI|nr:YdcF family protein [Fredinandcohnia sp. SECRCQ15]MCH1626986.1 YdcF family protein [Fredinandcohnia sp. SECRCQ15]